MTRKSYGDGSVFPRKDGRWEATAVIKGQRKSFYGRTKAEARQKRDEAKRQVARNEYVEMNRQKLKDYLEYWLQTDHGPRDSTSEMYEAYIRSQIIPALGHIQLQKLTVDHVQDFYNGLIKKGLQPSTIGTIHGILSKALNDAVRWERIAKNPARYAKRPKIEEKKYEDVILTEEQAHALIQAAQQAQQNGDQIGTITLVLIATGLRIGEVLALHWSDIDFERKQIHANKTLVYSKKKSMFVLHESKTKAGRRILLLPDFVLTALSAHKIDQLEKRLQAGSWLYPDLVFSNRNGGYLYDQWARLAFKRLAVSIGLPEEIHPHDLRHNMATFLIANRVPLKTVQEIMGHANIRITSDIYGHVTPAMKQDALNEINRLFDQA